MTQFTTGAPSLASVLFNLPDYEPVEVHLDDDGSRGIVANGAAG